ncbi:MAG: RHS repeat-associated core domain-containing protein [Prevotella sp.]|nr:RHS repeat-associated core domain-containing protein [Staphylococcus sp.]MCM1350699.1 RHS repeat-associated core domain-containing protein [Prevotella sp.]
MYECGYDTRGNIIGFYLQNQTLNETINSCEFTYNINNELVTATINGVTYNMTYSSIGLPDSYLGRNITYYMNQITSIIKGNSTVYYSYNANGIRTYKEVLTPNETNTTSYILEGNKIICEIIDGRDTDELNYYYDFNDNIVGFTYHDTKYLYLKNLQNDVIGIVDETGSIVVKYYYDGYGTIIDNVDTSGIDLAHINPFRYRSYYQDDETGWYYLNSRYYDPLTKRFITMDDISYLGASGTVLSYNLFSYCENNPVNNGDYDGIWLECVVCGVASAAVFGTLAFITCRILALDNKTTAIVTATFAGLGGIIGAALGPKFLAKNSKKLLNAINKIEKRNSQLKDLDQI